jgi:hypothetical protein
MSDRQYVPGHGFELAGANFSHHRTACEACQKYDPAQPRPAREEKFFDPNHPGAQAVRNATRYK